MTKPFRPRWFLKVVYCDDTGRMDEPALAGDTSRIQRSNIGRAGISVWMFFWGVGGWTIIGALLCAVDTRRVGFSPRGCCVLDAAVSVPVSQYARTVIETLPHYKLLPPVVLYTEDWKETLLVVW